MISLNGLLFNKLISFRFPQWLPRTHHVWWQRTVSANLPPSGEEHSSSLITCTFLTDDNTEIDGCPVRIWGFTIRTAPVGFIEPNLLSYFIIRECFCYRLLHSFNPVLFLFLRLCGKAERINISALLISLIQAN